jgi:hypothetical protein
MIEENVAGAKDLDNEPGPKCAAWKNANSKYKALTKTKEWKRKKYFKPRHFLKI